MSTKAEAIYADNCGVCGEEFLSSELTAVKLGGKTLSRVKVCLGCLVQTDVIQDYKDAAEIILELADRYVRPAK